MSQGGSDTAVVTADTSNSIPQRSVKNEICIIIGDMVKNGHNMEVVNAFLAHGYNMVILYSNDDKTDEKEIGGWIDKKFSHQIIDISKIDVKSSDAINKIFTHLASKLTSEEWSQCQVTVLIYNAALSLVKVVSSNNTEDEKKDNEKSGLTLKELAYCHDIAAHGFIHCVKEGLKFFDNKSDSNFHIFYGKPKCDKNSELMKIVDYGTSLISNHDTIKNDNKKFFHGIEHSAHAGTYLSLVLANVLPVSTWNTITMACKISTEIGESDPQRYYISTETGNNAITLADSQSTSNWTLGVYEDTIGTTKLYSRAYSMTTVGSDGTTYALGIDVSSTGVYSVLANSTSIDEYQKWNLEPMLTETQSTFNLFRKFRIVNQGRNRALTWEQTTNKDGTITYTLTSTSTIKRSAALWSLE